MSLQKIADAPTEPTCCASHNVQAGVYAAAVTLVALAVIFGALVVFKQYCGLHLGLLDDPMKEVIEFLGKYSFVPLVASIGIWAILVGVGIWKGCTKQSPSENPSKLTLDPAVGNPGGNLQNRDLIVATSRNDTAYQRMDSLLEEGQLDAAWQLYLNDSCFGKTGEENLIDDYDYLIQGGWTYLPSEKLLNAAIDQWLNEGGIITKKVCPEFIRDCAIGYLDFSNKFLKENKLWSCFAGCQEYCADIATAHPSFGVQVMISCRGLDIADNHRMEIFRVSYQNLLPLIAANQLDDENMKFLAKFLLCHERAIDKTDFDRIQEITQALVKQQNTFPPETEEHQNYFLYVALMDLVEGKLYFQGVYEKEGIAPLHPPIEMGVVDHVFLSDWIEGVARKISTATEEPSIRKGLLYLSLIQETSPSYSEAQMALGNIWMDLENYAEAGECFLRVSKLKNESESDAIVLATTCLLAQIKEGDDWEFVLRKDFECLAAAGKELRILNYRECKSLTLEQLVETHKKLKRKA